MDLVAFYAVDTIHRCKTLAGRVFPSHSILVSGLSKLCGMFEVCVLISCTVESEQRTLYDQNKIAFREQFRAK